MRWYIVTAADNSFGAVIRPLETIVNTEAKAYNVAATMWPREDILFVTDDVLEADDYITASLRREP